MIVYPAGLLTSAAVSMRYPRICYQTFTRDDAVIVTASTETTGGPKESPLEPDTVGYWEASALPAIWQIDLGSDQALDYVAIAGHTIGTEGATVLVETAPAALGGSPLAQVWTVLADDATPTDDAPLIFLDSPRTARYVRITITGTTPPKLAVIYAGSALAMTREPEMGFSPPNLSRTTELYNAMSRGGQFLGQGIKQMGVNTGISFQRLQQDWYRTYFDPFVLSARQFPYFLAWHPQLYPNETAYVWTAQDIKPSYTEWDFFGAAWEMQGIGYE